MLDVECWIKEKIMFQSGMLFAEVLTILVKILIIESISENKTSFFFKTFQITGTVK